MHKQYVMVFADVPGSVRVASEPTPASSALMSLASFKGECLRLNLLGIGETMFAASYRLLAPPGRAGLGIHAYSCFRLMFTHRDEIGGKLVREQLATRARLRLRPTCAFRDTGFCFAPRFSTRSRVAAASSPSGDEPMSHDTVIDICSPSLCGTREHARRRLPRSVSSAAASLCLKPTS